MPGEDDDAGEIEVTTHESGAKMVPLETVQKLRSTLRTIREQTKADAAKLAGEIAEARARASAAETAATGHMTALEALRAEREADRAEREAERFAGKLTAAGVSDPTVADFVRHRWASAPAGEDGKPPEFDAWFEAEVTERPWLRPAAPVATNGRPLPKAPPIDVKAKAAPPGAKMSPAQIRDLPKGSKIPWGSLGGS